MEVRNVKIKEYKHLYPDIPENLVIEGAIEMMKIVYPKVMDEYYKNDRNQRYAPPTKDGVRITITTLYKVMQEVLLKRGTIGISGILDLNTVPRKRKLWIYKEPKIVYTPTAKFKREFLKKMKWKNKKDLILQLSEEELVQRKIQSDLFIKNVIQPSIKNKKQKKD